MSDNKPYPKINSKVDVTFSDGEVKTYIIDASPSIANYLTREAGDTGFLNLRYGSEKSWCIPVDNIRDIEITAVGIEHDE